MIQRPGTPAVVASGSGADSAERGIGSGWTSVRDRSSGTSPATDTSTASAPRVHSGSVPATSAPPAVCSSAGSADHGDHTPSVRTRTYGSGALSPVQVSATSSNGSVSQAAVRPSPTPSTGIRLMPWSSGPSGVVSGAGSSSSGGAAQAPIAGPTARPVPANATRADRRVSAVRAVVLLMSSSSMCAIVISRDLIVTTR